jgi:hypothetical protein
MAAEARGLKAGAQPGMLAFQPECLQESGNTRQHLPESAQP